MAVNTGSLAEPYEYMGLAHFLEHMLFLGSKKYSNESHFEEVLKTNGGSCNAYTSSHETVYFFNVLNKKIEEILDIFSRFFIDPSFNESSVEREINAINSEHLKNINNDFWFGRQVIYNMAKKNSPIYQRFTTGTLETLKANNVKKLRDEMIQFYKSYYCPDNMSLVIQSNDINRTEELIVKYFSEIKSTKAKIDSNVAINKFNTNKEYQLIPSNNINEIMYFWDVPTFHKFISNKSIEVLNDIIEYNGINNLKYILKREGLASGLHCIYLEEGVYIVKITMCCEATKLSLEKINNIFRYYIDNFIQNTISLNDLYKYMESKYNLNYLYDIKINNGDLVNRISVNLNHYSFTNSYKGGHVIIKRDMNVLSDLVDRIKFSNVNIIYCTKNPIDKEIEFITDKYYLRKYGELSTSFIKKKDIKKEYKFQIDLDKSFLNINPIIIQNLDKYNIPTIVDKRVWFGGSSSFNEPHVLGTIFLSNKRLVNTLKDCILTLIACSIINQYVSEIFSQQFELGYSVLFSVSTIDGLVTLNINGLNANYQDFFRKVLQEIKEIQPEDIIIKNTIERIEENISNINNKSPWEYIDYLIGINKYKYSYASDEMHRMIKKIMKNDYMKMISRRIKRLTHMRDLSTTTIIYGNIDKKNIPIIKSKHKPSNVPVPRLLKSFSVKHPNKEEMNRLILMVMDCGKFTPYNAAQCTLLSLLLEQPTYQQLRTKYQLGYLVRSALQYDNTNYSISIRVQSALDIKFIETKMKEFIEWFKVSYLNSKDINRIFNKTKIAAKGLLLSKPTNMNDLIGKYIGEIRNKTYIFNRNVLIANEIDSIKLDTIKKLYNKIIGDIAVITLY